jgi:hypothetical protein
MTNKKPPDINIIDISQRREEKKKEAEKVPIEIIEKLETIVQKAKADKLVSIVMNFNYKLDKDEEDDGNHGSMYYNKSRSGLEVLGTVEMMKSQVFQLIYQDMHSEDDDDEAS